MKMECKLALGCAQLGLDYGIANSYGKPTFEEAVEIVDVAYKSGIRYFDTAEAYGDSFDRLIRIFEEDAYLNHVKIISKMSIKDDWLGIKTKLESNNIYGMLSHDGLKNWNIIGPYLYHLKDRGLIKKFGMSRYDYGGYMPDVEILQSPFNVFSDPIKFASNIYSGDIVPKVFMRSVFLQGVLLMKRTPKFAKEYVDAFRDHIIRHRIGRAEFALAYVMHTFPHSYIIIGVDNADQLKENVELYNSIQDKDWFDIVADWEENRPEAPQNVIDPRLWRI